MNNRPRILPSLPLGPTGTCLGVSGNLNYCTDTATVDQEEHAVNYMSKVRGKLVAVIIVIKTTWLTKGTDSSSKLSRLTGRADAVREL
jgi:hypothetical protein